MNLITRTRKPTKFQKAMAAFMAAFLLFSPSGLMARNLPAGAKVVKGKVNIRTSGDVMDIDQLSTKAIVNWRTFDIGEANTVNVNQPSSLGKAAMLARVVGNDPSSIFGKLNADQTFYLVNPNGVYFGKNSRVDVGAAFAASTLDITDADFLSGRVIFKGDSKASIINEGAINAASVALIAKDVANKGTINAAQIAVVGTNEVELFNFGNDAKLTLKFADTADASTAVNEGELNGASDVILFADNGKADNSNGIIRAENAEISGAYVDILNLGDIEAKSLVIDPDGKLYIGNFEDKAPRWTPALGGDPDDPNYTPNPDEFTGGDGTSTQDAAGDFYLSTTSLNNFLNKYAENGLSELKLEYTDGIIVQDNVAIQTEGGNVSLALDAKDSNLRIGDNFVWGGAADLKLSGATITVDGKFTATNNLSVVEFNAPKGIVSNGANPVDIRVNKLNVANKETGFIADGDLSIAVSTDKMIVDYDILSKDGDVTLQALDVAGAIFVRGGSIKANGTISMKAANDIQVKNAEGNADPVLYANDINIEALQFTTEAPIEANNALNLNVAVIGDLASDADDIAVAGDINVLGLVGTDTLSINANLLSGKAVTVNADSSIAANAAILAEDNVVITAGQFGKVKIADTIAATNVSITAGRGAIELTDDGSINADNTIGLTAYDVYLKFEEATSPVLSADVINIDAWQFSNATETTASAPIDAANALNIKAAVIGVVGNADINVAGDINIQGQTGNDTLTINSSLESGHSVTIAADSNFAVKGAILAEDDVIITAMPNSKISIAEGITATNVTVDAGRGSTIELTDNGSISADNTIGLTAYDIYLKYETTPEFPALSADVINIDAWQFSTATETTDSAPIDAANALNIKAAVIGIVDADDNVKGDISVAGDINIQGQTGSDTLTINSTLESGHNVTIASDSNFAVKGAILAEDDVVITAMPNSKVTIAEGITATNVTVNAGQGSTIALTDNGSISADNTISLAAYDIYLKYEDIPELPVLNADIINIDAWQFSTATETTASAPIDAANALNIKAAVIGVVGNADINVAGDINIQGQTGSDTLTINSTLESGHNVTIASDSNFAVKGAILAEDAVVITAMPNSKVTIAEGITATNVTVNAGQGSTIALTDNGFISADNTISLTAYDIYLKYEDIPELPVLNADIINIDAWQFSTATETTDSAPIDAANALNIKAAVIGIVDGDDNVKGDISVAGDINIQGQTGSDTLTINSTLESGHNVTIASDSNFAVKGAILAEDAVVITAMPNSKVNIAESITATNVTVDAGRGSTIELTDNGFINADNTISLTAYDIYLKYEDIPELPVLNADIINIDAWQFSTATETTDSAPIDAANALNIKAAVIGIVDADDNVKGDISVAGDINIQGQTGNETLTINSTLESGRTVTIAAASNFAVKGAIVAEDDVIITAMPNSKIKIAEGITATNVTVNAGRGSTIVLTDNGSINADKVIDMAAYDIYLQFEEIPELPVLNADVINIDAWQFSTATETTDSAPIEANSALNIKAAVIGILDADNNPKGDIDVAGDINVKGQEGNETLTINSSLKSGRSVTINADSDLTIKGAVEAEDDVLITAEPNSRVKIIEGILGTNVTVNAGRGSTITLSENGSINADGIIDLTAYDIYLQFEETPEVPVLNASVINIDAWQFSTATEDTDSAPIEASSALNIKAAIIGLLDADDAPKGDIDVTGNINVKGQDGNDLLIIDSSLKSNRSITITSDSSIAIKGEIMGTDVSVDAGNVGTITLSAEGSINADKVIDMTAYDIYLKFEETPDTPVLNAPVINIDAWQFSTATEDTDSAPIEATSELNIQAAVIGMLDEGDNVKADIDVSGNINIRDQKGNDTLAINSTLTSGKSVTILSESDLTIKGEIQAADDVDITSASETKVSVIAPISGNNVSIDAGRGSTIIVKDGGAITADSDINLTAMDVLLQFEETPEDAVLNANIINVDAFTFSTATEDTDAAPIEAMTALNIKASQVGVLDGDSPKGEIAVSGNINIIDYAPGAELTIAADLTSNEGDVTIISNFNNVNVKGEVKAEKGAVSIDVAHSNLKLDKAITAKNAVRINAAQDTANANRNDDDQDNVLVIVDDITATDGNVVITTKGDGIKVESDATVTGDEVAMETNGDIEINGTVDAQEGVDLKTVEGDIKAEGTIKVDGYVNMRAAKGSIKATKISGNVTNGDIYAKSDITVKDDASITSTIVLTKDGNIKVEAGTDIRNSNFSAANGNVEITAKNNSILNASVQAGKIAILTAGNEIDGSTVTAYGDRGSNTITAEADYIGGDSFIAETGHIELIPRRKMYGVVAWEKQYEVRPDPEPVPEDEKPFFYRADREKGELMAHLRALPFVYFPHVRASFDGPAYDKNIDYILTGSSVIEGLPEGFGPGTLIDFNAIDKSFLWNTSDDTVQK